MSDLKYKRVLLKMSGEVFEGDLESGIDGGRLMSLAKEIKELVEIGAQVGVVVGGGNIWRFRDFKEMTFLKRTSSDTMGMMATVMNSLALEAALKELGVNARAMSALPCPKAIETYTIRDAQKHMDNGEVLIFGGGTGVPHFTTDSAAALRALEMNCDVLMKATKVDFVYDKDPMEHDDALKFEEMTFQDVIEQELGVMDLTCAALCNEGGMKMLVFNLTKSGNMKRALLGEKIGTIIN